MNGQALMYMTRVRSFSTDAYLLHLPRKHNLTLASLESRMATLDDPLTPTLFVVS